VLPYTAAAMTEYLCIFVDAAGRPAGGKWFESDDDAEAVVRAEELARDRQVEGYVLWHGFAKIAFCGNPLVL